MTTKTYRFFQNIGGMNLRFNDLLLDEREAEEIVNLHASPYGSWSSRNVGYTVVNADPVENGASIAGLYEYITLDGSSHFMVAAGEKLYTLAPGTGVLSGRYRRWHALQFVMPSATPPASVLCGTSGERTLSATGRLMRGSRAR